MTVARKNLAESVGQAFREGSPSTGARRNITVIQAGWGSSGYYSPEVLERDIPRIFPVGTQMYLNHPTAKEEKERPERDLRDLVGKVVEPPRMAGIDSVSVAQVYEHWIPTIDAIAADIGLSIRAFGSVEEGAAGGKTGVIVQSLTEGLSIDYVTKAGAGGSIGELIESARDKSPSFEDQAVTAFNAILESAGKMPIPAELLKEVLKTPVDADIVKEAARIGEMAIWESGELKEAEEYYDYFLERDISKEERIALAEKGQAIPIKDDKGNVIGGRFPMANCGDVKAAAMSVGRGKGDNVKGFIEKVASKLSCPVPFKESGPGRRPKENHMEVDEKQLASMVAEAVSSAMKKKKEEDDEGANKKKVEEAEQRADKAEKDLLTEKAARIVAKVVGEKDKMPSETKGRVVEAAMSGELPTLSDGSLDERALEERANTAIRKEAEYVKSLLGESKSGGVEGVGAGTDGLFESLKGGGGSDEEVEVSEADVKALTESFIAQGMSKEAAQAAAEGR